MKTKKIVIIVILSVFAIAGIVGAFVIRNVLMRSKDIQPNIYYSRGEALYLLQMMDSNNSNGISSENSTRMDEEDTDVESDADVESDIESESDMDTEAGVKSDTDMQDGFNLGDMKNALRQYLGMGDEEIGQLLETERFASLTKKKDTQILNKEEFIDFYEYLLSNYENSAVISENILLLDSYEKNIEENSNEENADSSSEDDKSSDKASDNVDATNVLYYAVTDKATYEIHGYDSSKSRQLAEAVNQSVDSCMKVYSVGNTIIEILGSSSELVEVSNVWIENQDEDGLHVFLKGYHKVYPCNVSVEDSQKLSSSLADIGIMTNNVSDVVLKSDVITAKVLSVADDGVELEGYGKLDLSKNYRIYKIYGELAVEPVSQILVGYNTTNFVVADGVIEAALITEPMKAENIRVVLQNSDYSSLIHNSVIISSDAPFTLSFHGQEKVFEAEEKLELNLNNGYMAEGRVSVRSNEENGKIRIESIARNGSAPAYRGTIEVAPYEDQGLIIVNEVSLEEYLYTVVPSEMPTSYGDVALEVQAICARGYAYMKMQDGTYAKYGAHVDDSTMTQVYNSVSETEESVLAVKKTYGMVPTYDGSVIQAYFFSTSCGTTCTNADVWDGEALPYLQDTMEGGISFEASANAELKDEMAFRAFIDDSSSYDSFEKDCSLYRWNIDFTQEEMTEAINSTIESRYNANPEKVLTLQADGSYISQPIKSVGEVSQVEITERGNSGIVKEIKVVGSNATVLVQGQTNARALMTPANVTIYRQDGAQSNGWSMIPSPFYYVARNDDGGFTIAGGGFGHGVGMSQNGAKALADMGYSAEDIIKHYYTGIDIKNIYQ